MIHLLWNITDSLFVDMLQKFNLIEDDLNSFPQTIFCAEKLRNTLYLACMFYKAYSSQLCAKVTPQEAPNPIRKLNYKKANNAH